MVEPLSGPGRAATFEVKINADTLLTKSGLAKAVTRAHATPEGKAFPKHWFPEQTTHL